jgi:hypothetical protein
MIKLFRKIRQQLLTQNKIFRYLLYAIGEILLVVIGIVIAVQIGNWNNNMNRRKMEKTLLSQVKEEILTTLNYDLESDLNLLLLGQRSYERILNYIQQDVAYADSMCFDFWFLIQDEYIYPKEAAYGKLKEEGLDIIQNDSLKYLLQSLYESQFPRLSKDNSFHPDISVFLSDYYQQHFKPNYDMSLKFKAEFPNDTIQLPRSFTNDESKIFQRTEGFVPLDFKSLKNDYKFQMLLRQTRKFRGYKIRRYRITKNIAKLAIPLIEKELTQNN